MSVALRLSAVREEIKPVDRFDAASPDLDGALVAVMAESGFAHAYGELGTLPVFEY